MKISTILDHIDSGHMALPEFQRGYVWNRDQVRGLMQSLYRRHPVGSLLVWATQSVGADHRGDGVLSPGVVKLLLDGQQRISTLYGIVRGKAPQFFDGNAKAFAGLHFHLGTEEFRFWQPMLMGDDPLWIDVSKLMKEGLNPFFGRLNKIPEVAADIEQYFNPLSRIHTIPEIDLHVEEVTGEDKTIDVVVDIFNRVNSGGTKLSKGDLALAKICAELPEARKRLKNSLAKWHMAGYSKLNLDWLMRCINTISTGEAKFGAMHELTAEQFADGLNRADTGIDQVLNMIAGRFGLDHDRVLFGRYAIPVMVHYLDRRGGKLSDAAERDRLLFWYLTCAMWGRYSGSTESIMDKDLKLLEEMEGGLGRLVEELRLWRGGLEVLPEHFGGWSKGARFYPVLYLITRVGEARDWGNGLPLKEGLLGKMSKLEVHHIFPKAQLYKSGYHRSEVNAVANFCFLTKVANLEISDTRPEVYFPEIDERFPGSLASQWIPMDPLLWKIENYREFLEARRGLLAEAVNDLLEDLLHGEPLDGTYVTAEPAMPVLEPVAAAPALAAPPHLAESPMGSIDSEEEEQLLLEVHDWVVEQDLPEGELLYELTDEAGNPLAIFDLAWPEGLQPGLSDPVALLIDEGREIYDIANRHGYRYFTSAEDFRHYVLKEILAQEETSA